MGTKYQFKTTPERSEIMKKIRGINTKPELVLRKALWAKGYRYRINVKGLPGKPDIVFRKYKVVIFVDGEFWHGYDWDEKKKKIKSNRDYWIPKIERNIARDSEHNAYYEYNGWKVLRFWQNQIIKNINDCVKEIDTAISSKPLR